MKKKRVDNAKVSERETPYGEGWKMSWSTMLPNTLYTTMNVSVLECVSIHIILRCHIEAIFQI